MAAVTDPNDPVVPTDWKLVGLSAAAILTVCTLFALAIQHAGVRQRADRHHVTLARMASRRHQFPSKEPSTLTGLAVVACPACKGDDGHPTGSTMLVIESASGHKARAVVCDLCQGKKRIRRDVYNAYVAGRTKGTPPPKR